MRFVTDLCLDHALIQQATILNLRKPDPYDIRNVQQFLANKLRGTDCMAGQDHFAWGHACKPNSHSKELICLETVSRLRNKKI